MRVLLFAATTIGMGAAATTSSLAQAVDSQSQQCLRVQNSFDLTVHASYVATAPLFGPDGERKWAGEHWDPQFVYPLPARDEEGAVFTIQHGPVNAIWVNTAFDVQGKHFQYVYFIAGIMVTTIDVHFKPVDASNTLVHVVYTRTSLTPDGNAHVTAMGDRDRHSGAEWQQAIDRYLAAARR